MKTHRLTQLLLAVMFLIAAPLSQAQIKLTATDQGSFSLSPYSLVHDSSDHNTATGTGNDLSLNRSFFNFDLGNVFGSIQAATLHIWNPYSINPYTEAADPQSVSLHQVSHDSENFTTDYFEHFSSFSAVNTLGVQLFNDLGDGNQLGSTTVSEEQKGSWVDIVLNQDGILNLNSGLGSLITLGAALDGWDNALLFDNYYSGDKPILAELSLTLAPVQYATLMHQPVFLSSSPSLATASAIPEPATYGFIGLLILGGLILHRRFSRS